MQWIRTGKYKDLIDQLNSLDPDSKEQREFKSTQLPGIVWQGQFDYRDSVDIVQHSGLVAIDIDHLPPDEMAKYRKMISANKYTYAMFTSPRRDGLKVIIRIPPDIENHREYVAAIGQQYKKHAYKYYDHFDDICRLCFVSYDPDIYFNPDCQVFSERVKLKVFTTQSQDISQIASDIQYTFNRVMVWADKNSDYTDGNKHKHLIKLFTACNRTGVPKDDAVRMAYNRYAATEGCDPVSMDDYANRADSVYRLYEHEFGTKTFDDSPKETPAETPAPADTSQTTVINTSTDPVTYYNNTQKCLFHAKHCLEKLNWKSLQDTSPQVWQAPGVEADEVSATFDTCFHVITGNDPFESGYSYTPFQILVLTTFSGNHRAATEWVIMKYFEEHVLYMRVGTDYFKLIDKTDRFGICHRELKRWTKDEIKQDHGKAYLDKIPHFDDFTIEPNNIHYRPVVNNCYNLYREFPHTPQQGEWPWTRVLLEHIFGEQYDLGIRYLQALFMNPDRIMPILVLVSKERQTGKTTFINWLGMIFGDNMANISPEDLVNGFNSTYAASNIIAVEETIIEKALTVEKIKALATTKFITVNQKFVSQYRMPFFGKIILTSNNENKFARIDQEEIRFFIRKVPVPTIHNHFIESDMKSEIPAFLHYLTTLDPVDWSRDRTGFTPEELNNESLANVKRHSMSETSREIIDHITDVFNNRLPSDESFQADSRDIKEEFFPKDLRSSYSWIREVLKDQLNLEQESKSIYYHPFNDRNKARTGRPFTFIRTNFPDIVEISKPVTMPIDTDPF